MFSFEGMHRKRRTFYENQAASSINLLNAGNVSRNDVSSFSPSLSAVFENGQLVNYIQKAYINGEEEQLEAELKAFSEEKKQEINDLCEKNYRLFLDAVEDLFSVKQEASALKESVVQLQDAVNKAGGDLKDAIENLNSIRKAKQNTQKGRDALKHCMEVVLKCKRIQEYLNNKKYAAALRLMGELENGGLNEVLEYDFGEYVAKRIPMLKNKVLKDVTHEFNVWLSDARDAAVRVGKAALVCAAEDGKEQRKAAEELLVGLEGWVAPLKSARAPVSYRELTEAAGRLHLSPPHRCLYIYSRLGYEDEFKRLYIEARRTRANAGWEGGSPLDDLCGAVGFFVIEDAVGLRIKSTSHLHRQWENALMTAQASMDKKIESLDVDQFVQQVMLAMKVARALYLPLERLQYIAQRLARSYLSGKARVACADILKIFLDPAHSGPLVLQNETEWKALIMENMLHKPVDVISADTLSWKPGATMPFSRSVPLALDVVKDFIKMSQVWMIAIGSGDVEIREAISDSVVDLLNGLLKDLVVNVCAGTQGEVASIGGLVQLLINVQYMTAAVNFWGRSEELLQQQLKITLPEGPLIEFANSSQSTFQKLLTTKLRMLLAPLQKGDKPPATLLGDVFPYLEAVLPSGAQLPQNMLYPLQKAALNSICVAFKGSLEETLLLPAHVSLLKQDLKKLHVWCDEHLPEVVAVAGPLFQLDQLADLLSSGEVMLEFAVEEKRRKRWPLLSISDEARNEGDWTMSKEEVMSWLSRLREDGTSFFGAAKMDKHAEQLCKRLK